jgi:hypothetical protein
MSDDPIEAYLHKLRRRPRMRSCDDRLLSEVEDHLRTTARALEADHGLAPDAAMREAVARLGNPRHLRPRLLDPSLLALAAPLTVATVAFLAGVVAWDMRSAIPACPPNTFCFVTQSSGGHLHPLRAEMLWAASALALLVSATMGLRRPRGRAAIYS